MEWGERKTRVLCFANIGKEKMTIVEMELLNISNQITIKRFELNNGKRLNLTANYPTVLYTESIRRQRPIFMLKTLQASF